MVDASFLAAILDSLKDPVLVADTEHVTRYMNRAAVAHYEEGESLIGRSLLDCHNKQSQQMMIEILAEMHQGLDERLITDDGRPHPVDGGGNTGLFTMSATSASGGG